MCGVQGLCPRWVPNACSPPSFCEAIKQYAKVLLQAAYVQYIAVPFDHLTPRPCPETWGDLLKMRKHWNSLDSLHYSHLSDIAGVWWTSCRKGFEWRPIWRTGVVGIRDELNTWSAWLLVPIQETKVDSADADQSEASPKECQESCPVMKSSKDSNVNACMQIHMQMHKMWK